MAALVRFRSSAGRFLRRARPLVVRASTATGGVARRAGRSVARLAEKGLGEIVAQEAVPAAVGGAAAELESQAAESLGFNSPMARIVAPLGPATAVYFLGNKASGRVRRLAFNVANAHVAVSAAKATAHYSGVARANRDVRDLERRAGRDLDGDGRVG